jgi:hypothetical protein
MGCGGAHARRAAVVFDHGCGTHSLKSAAVAFFVIPCGKSGGSAAASAALIYAHPVLSRSA